MKQCLNLLVCTCAAALFLGGDYASCREYTTYEDYTSYEEWSFDSLDTDQLASAPTIVIGKIVAINHAGVDKLMSRVDPKVINSPSLVVDMYEVSVSIERTIKGAIADREIVVEALLVASDQNCPFDLQVLAADKRFVFFLTRRKGGKKWKGVSPFEFALRVDEAAPTSGDLEKCPAADVFRLIAKENIRKADELCAAKWFTFLGQQQYNKKEDFEFCLELVDDPRLCIRGEALALLCEYHPKTPDLYDKAMKFVDDTALTPTLAHAILRIRVINQLLNTLDHCKPEVRNEAIKTLWLKNEKTTNVLMKHL